jgi:mono/diheme cytochrome c family protein
MRVSRVRLRRASRVLLATLVLAGVQASGARAQTAQDTYAQRCTPCHGANGKGDGPSGKFLTPPPKDFATALNGQGDDWIAKVITQGGPAVGLSAAMPPSTGLSEDQSRDLIQYIKKLGS